MAMHARPPPMALQPRRHQFHHNSNLHVAPSNRTKLKRARFFKNGRVDHHNTANTAFPHSHATAENVRQLCREGQLREALRILDAMDEQGIPVDIYTYASLLQSCTLHRALSEGKQVHSHILSSRIDLDDLLAGKLVSMYAKCGSLRDARLVFDQVPKQEVYLWNVMIGEYVDQGFCEEALMLYRQLPDSCMKPDHFTFPRVLRASAELSTLQQGKEIHDHVIRSGFGSHLYVGNAVLSLYAKCGCVDSARQVFDKMSQRNVVSWNAMIAGYGRNGRCEEALDLFRQMQLAGVKPDLATMAGIVPICACLGALQEGKEIHAYAIRSGLGGDVLVGNALIEMYVELDLLEHAIKVFDKMAQRDLISWTALISGYAQNQHYEEALECFWQMGSAGFVPDAVTITSLLPVCAHMAALQQGKGIHGYIIRNGFDSDVFVENALIDMYAKCKSMVNAQLVFDKMSEKDVVSWSAIVAGYSQNGHWDNALKLFHQMQLAVEPNWVTIACILPACAGLAALQQGKEIHGYTIKSGFFMDICVQNGLIDMYVKCGSITDAHRLFDNIPQRDVVSWTVMIAGYGMHGRGKDAVALFHQMKQAGVKPDHITFIAVLSACSRAGLVIEGWHYFRQMSEEWHITPELVHYACMVDLLGRAGRLDEAHNFIKEMPIEPDAAVWGALLGACRIHSNVELAERVAEHIFVLEPENTGYHALLSNIYADAGRWDAVTMLRALVKDKGRIKNPGCSWIEVNNTVHAFLVGDRSHPQAEKIYARLENLAKQMVVAGYVRIANFLFYGVQAAVKEHWLCGHNEMLAIAFGLINTWPGTPLRITKNLRMCSNCHSATMLISKMVRREITVRDINQIHHFKNGLCSCGDYE